MLGKNKEAQATAAPARHPQAAGATTGTSLIGQGMTIDGNCRSEGFVKIEGKVSGDVASNGAEIAKSGQVEGDVVASPSTKGVVVTVGGRVKGRVRAGSVLVPDGGVVLGGVEADEVTVHGRVEGGLTVSGRLAIASTAVIVGQVRTERLTMEEGGQVNGTIHMGKQALAKKVEEGARPAHSAA